jgi:hypothetical protein
VEIICGICETTIDKTPGPGLITSLCMECRKELAEEAKKASPEKGVGMQKQYPIRQEGLAAFDPRKVGR